MYSTNDEIKQLQADLMSRSTTYSFRTNARRNAANNTENYSADNISTIVTKEIKKTKNGDIGLLFEENIRKTLEIEYNWKNAFIPRHFFYREIIFKEKHYYLSPFRGIDAKGFSIFMNPHNKDCQFINKSQKEVDLFIKEKEKISNVTYQNKEFIIGPPKEIEVDGIYENFNYNKLQFNDNEIEILFDNTHINKYNYAVVEIKLNANKIRELFGQLKADKNIFSKFVENNNAIIYLGFVNITKNDIDMLEDLNLSKICGDLPCIIFGVKDGTFCDRIITNPIDWKLVNQFYSFQNEIKESVKKGMEGTKQFMEDKIENINEFVQNEVESIKDYVKKELVNFKQEISVLIQDEILFTIQGISQSKRYRKNNTFLQRKRKRRFRKK